MGIYYVAGVPYSDELYHHGIIGQKWGVRRYQNRDGSLTSEGRKHYGVKNTGNKVAQVVSSAGRAVGSTVKKTGSAVGKAASATAKYAGKRFKMNHPSLMTDQELKDYTQRLIAEKNYSQMMNQYESPSAAGRATKLVKNLVRDTAGVPFAVVKGVGRASGDILTKGANTLADAGFRKLAQEMTKSKLERENDKLDRKIRNKELQDRLDDTNLERANKRLSSMVQNKELREKLEPKSKEGALSKAMSIINSPSSTASDIQEAKNILQNYSVSKKFMEGILGNANNKAATAEVAKDVSVSAPSISEPAASFTPVTKSGYAPAEWNPFKNWNMRSMESLGDDYRPSYTPPSTSYVEPVSFTPSYPDWWTRMVEDRKRYGY